MHYKILCMHGGLSPELENLDKIVEIQRPTEIPDSGLLCDLLWSDPDPSIEGWSDSDRGVSCTFGADRVADFLDKNDLDLICRGHQVHTTFIEYYALKWDCLSSTKGRDVLYLIYPSNGHPFFFVKEQESLSRAWMYVYLYVCSFKFVATHVFY